MYPHLRQWNKQRYVADLSPPLRDPQRCVAVWSTAYENKNHGSTLRRNKTIRLRAAVDVRLTDSTFLPPFEFQQNDTDTQWVGMPRWTSNAAKPITAGFSTLRRMAIIIRDQNLFQTIQTVFHKAGR